MPILFERELARHRTSAAALLERLVRAPLSAEPVSATHAVVGVLCEAISQLGLTPTLISPPPTAGRSVHPAIVTTWGDGTAAVYLHARYRAVPRSDPRQFEPWWDGDTFYGRATADMNGGIVALLYAIRALAEHRSPLAGKVVLVLVPGEDDRSAREAIAQLVPLGVITSNGTAMYTPLATGSSIWFASRGLVRVRVTVRSPANLDAQGGGHADAMAHAMPILQQLFDLRHKVVRRETQFLSTPGPKRRSVMLVATDADGASTLETSEGVCRFTVERRMNPDESFEIEKRDMLDVFEQARRDGIDCVADVLEEAWPMGVYHGVDTFTSLQRAICEVKMEVPTAELVTGPIDTQLYAPVGVPSLAYGPGEPMACAGMREFIKMRSVMTTAAIYAMTIVHQLGDPMGDPTIYS